MTQPHLSLSYSPLCYKSKRHFALPFANYYLQLHHTSLSNESPTIAQPTGIYTRCCICRSLWSRSWRAGLGAVIIEVVSITYIKIISIFSCIQTIGRILTAVRLCSESSDYIKSVKTDLTSKKIRASQMSVQNNLKSPWQMYLNRVKIKHEIKHPLKVSQLCFGHLCGLG